MDQEGALMTNRNVREKEEVTVHAHPSLSRLGDPTFIPYNGALDIDGSGKSNYTVDIKWPMKRGSRTRV